VFVITGRMGQKIKWEEAAGFPSLALMTAEEIHSWAQQGMEFGAHSRTHPHLTNLSSPMLQDEIAASGKDLQELLQTPITSFAYPYGSSDEGACEVAAKVYDLAFTTDEGVNTLGTDPYLLLRAMVLPEDSRFTLWWRSRMGFDPVARLGLQVRRAIIKTFFGSAEDPSEAVGRGQ
jgi:peptidoglycan/xylan/chitin deacetylase (PgdA/CDA1 family)